ncbi:MAG TPA: hypothetical protein PKX78_02835 [Candidatus Woesebacteria bacterium]|nr:hypothetical protein [Candidatus Woesebacteria bacterium]
MNPELRSAMLGQGDAETGKESDRGLINYLLRMSAVGLLRLVERVKYQVEVSPESLANLRAANGILGSEALIAYANHKKFIDAAYIILVLRAVFSNLKAAGVPMAEKYTQPNLQHPMSVLFAPLAQLVKSAGVELLPTHQEGVTIKNLFGHKKDSSGNVVRVLGQFINKGRGHLVGINPESRRNPDAGLLPFRNGLAVLIANNPDVKVLPIGFIYVETTKTMQILVGEPFIPVVELGGDTNAQSSSDQVDKDTIAEITALCRVKLESLLESAEESQPGE